MESKPAQPANDPFDEQSKTIIIIDTRKTTFDDLVEAEIRDYTCGVTDPNSVRLIANSVRRMRAREAEARREDP